MCIYTVKKQTFKIFYKKNPQGGYASLPNVPKLCVSGIKDTAKTANTKIEACHVAYS